MDGLLVILVPVWLIYVWIHLLIWDTIHTWVGGEAHPWVQKIAPAWGYVLVALVALSWATFIGAAISGWLGILPALIIYYITKPFAK